MIQGLLTVAAAAVDSVARGLEEAKTGFATQASDLTDICKEKGD
jgi:hypothetical protein